MIKRAPIPPGVPVSCQYGMSMHVSVQVFPVPELARGGCAGAPGSSSRAGHAGGPLMAGPVPACLHHQRQAPRLS